MLQNAGEADQDRQSRSPAIAADRPVASNRENGSGSLVGWTRTWPIRRPKNSPFPSGRYHTTRRRRWRSSGGPLDRACYRALALGANPEVYSKINEDDPHSHDLAQPRQRESHAERGINQGHPSSPCSVVGRIPKPSLSWYRIMIDRSTSNHEKTPTNARESWSLGALARQPLPSIQPRMASTEARLDFAVNLLARPAWE